jgi:hypothetical protein
LSEERVAKYAYDMRRGDEFPPIRVARVGKELCVLDGFHRVEAARSARLDAIAAYIAPMSERAAVSVAIGANARHGLNLNRKDKRRCFDLYCAAGGHLTADGSVKSLRQIRADLDGIAWPQTISNWLKDAGISPAEDPAGPNVAWQDEEPESAELENFMGELHALENTFHQLSNSDQATAGKRLQDTLDRLFQGEPVTNVFGLLDI